MTSGCLSRVCWHILFASDFRTFFSSFMILDLWLGSCRLSLYSLAFLIIYSFFLTQFPRAVTCPQPLLLSHIAHSPWGKPGLCLHFGIIISTASHGSQTEFELMMGSKSVLNSWSLYVYIFNAGITSVHSHTWLMWYWVYSPGLHVC